MATKKTFVPAPTPAPVRQFVCLSGGNLVGGRCDTLQAAYDEMLDFHGYSADDEPVEECTFYEVIPLNVREERMIVEV